MVTDVMEKTGTFRKDGDGKILASHWEGASSGNGGQSRAWKLGAGRLYHSGTAGSRVLPRERPWRELPLAGGRGQACRA